MSSIDTAAKIDRFVDEVTTIIRGEEKNFLKNGMEANNALQSWEQKFMPAKEEFEFNRRMLYQQKMNTNKLQKRFVDLEKLRTIENTMNCRLIKQLEEKCNENSFLQFKYEMKGNYLIKKCEEIRKKVAEKEESINEMFENDESVSKLNELRDEINGLLEIKKSLGKFDEKEETLKANCNRLQLNINNLNEREQKLADAKEMRKEERDKLMVTLRAAKVNRSSNGWQ